MNLSSYLKQKRKEYNFSQEEIALHASDRLVLASVQMNLNKAYANFFVIHPLENLCFSLQTKLLHYFAHLIN